MAVDYRLKEPYYIYTTAGNHSLFSPRNPGIFTEINDKKQNQIKTSGGRGRRNGGLNKFVYECGMLAKSTVSVEQRTIARPLIVVLDFTPQVTHLQNWAKVVLED